MTRSRKRTPFRVKGAIASSSRSFRLATVSLTTGPSSPFATGLLDCPHGVGFYVADPLHAAAITVARGAVGLVAGYNALMLGALLATMIAVYLLALEVTRSRAAAAGAGLLARYSPFLRAALGSKLPDRLM